MDKTKVKEKQKIKDLVKQEEAEIINVKLEREEVQQLRDWYQKNMIDTGYAQKLEKAIIKGIEYEKTTIEILGSVATIILLFYPVGGRVAKVCTVLATPLLSKLVDLQGEIEKQILIRGKRAFEIKILGVDGSSKDVIIEGKGLVSGLKSAVSVLKDVKGNKTKVK